VQYHLYFIPKRPFHEPLSSAIVKKADLGIRLLLRQEFVSLLIFAGCESLKIHGATKA
jgi:hypothetical protein